MRGAPETPPKKYRLYKRSGQAIVTLSGQDHYLGLHGSVESKTAYDLLIS